MKKLLIIFGTRPEAIKMAPLYHALSKNSHLYEVSVCVTAQHRDMLDQVLKVFEICPDIDLNIMRKGQDLYDVTSRVLLGVRNVIKDIAPNLVLVHGDTTTAFAASLSAFYESIPVAHIEAGLRTNNINSPFPEEMNRQFITKLATYHFSPTVQSAQNLLNERVCTSNIYITGNTVIDSLFWVLNKIDAGEKKSDLITNLKSILKFDFINKPYVLITGHRRENFGNGFSNITAAIKELSILFPLVHFVYPVHLNPNVFIHVNNELGNIKNIHLIEPQEYEAFAVLLRSCLFVLTDSGGIQEEAPSLGKPVLVMRESTERPEAVIAGTVRLVGTSREKIVENSSLLISDKHFYETMSKSHNPYGDGTASKKIVSIINQII